MSGHQGVDTALLGRAATAPADPRHSPSVPHRGAGWAGANPEPAPRTDAPPTANAQPTWKEVNRMWRPSLEELQRHMDARL